MLADHWILRKTLALMGSGLVLTLLAMAGDTPTDASLHPNPFRESLGFWLLMLWFGAIPALLVTGLSDLVGASVGRKRFWVALSIHLSGTFLLMVLVNGYETPWGPENRDKLGFCTMAVLSFFALDEVLRCKSPGT